MLTCFTPSTRHLASPSDRVLEATLFCDGAYNIKLADDITNCAVRLIHNNRTHDDWILLYLLVDQLTQRQCQIYLTLPYISYGRQVSTYLQTLLKPLQIPSVQEIITVDLHQDRAGIVNLSTASLVANDIKARGLETAILVAPDGGAIHRVDRLAKLMGQDVVGLRKVRSSGQVAISSLTDLPRGASAIIVDDMVDTGSTLQACVRYLLEHGIEFVHVIATHGVLSFGIGEWADGFASLTFLNTLAPLAESNSARWLDVRGLLCESD